MNFFCSLSLFTTMKLFNYERRKSSVVSIGHTPLGGDYPVRLQSMTNTSTMDTENSIQQSIRIINAGGEYVRLTAQGIKEAENLRNIKTGLRQLHYDTPLIADIHFNPKAAEAAAKTVEKVRINPGNFVDPVKTFQTFEYTDEEYAGEIEKIRERFVSFLNICKENHTAIRIGVNHGSLSDRIMSRYGDTPQGMVESCMEFLRICIAENFTDVVLSIKASSTLVMVRTVRLLVQQMEKEEMSFPLHLGVTEAGDGEDGRIKSAVGIGTLLLEGIGDTIRVSLSEDPELEIPVAKHIVNYAKEKEGHTPIEGKVCLSYRPFDPERRKTLQIDKIGGSQVPVVISNRTNFKNRDLSDSFIPDYLYIGNENPDHYPEYLKRIVDFQSYIPQKNIFPLFNINEKKSWAECPSELKFLKLEYPDLDEEMISLLKQASQTVIILSSMHSFSVGEQKAFIHRIWEEGINLPVIISRNYNENEKELLQIKSAMDCGVFFLDMLADGILLYNDNQQIPIPEVEACSFGILQATGRRISKTEYISCPSCGRTLFDLQSTIRKIKEATSHLKGLKIGIMGCIVNGPGEMADADYGYVGAGPGKVSLYKGKECVEKNIPANEAVERLINLIKKNGDWQ